jgi:hypothetical protein
MSITKIKGSQIAQSTDATISALRFLNTSGNAIFQFPVGTTAQRPAGASDGTVRFNTDINAAEIRRPAAAGQASNWFPLSGGGPAIGEKSIIRANSNIIDENLTIGPTGTQIGVEYTNGMSAGPITIASGRTITIQNGAAWSIR